VKVGEFISDSFEKLIKKEQDLTKQFYNYCKKHNRKFETRFCIRTADPVLFVLEIIIKDGNNGEIKNC
jgi:hypothetical protein